MFFENIVYERHKPRFILGVDMFADILLYLFLGIVDS